MTAPENAPFLQRRPIRRALRRWLDHWRARHRHPFNFGLHLLGIPLSLGAAPALLLARPWDEWYWAAAAFVGGYGLQWVGHRVEGNDLGEWAGVKRLLGLPYVAIAPQYHRPGEDGPDTKAR